MGAGPIRIRSCSSCLAIPTNVRRASLQHFLWVEDVGGCGWLWMVVGGSGLKWVGMGVHVLAAVQVNWIWAKCCHWRLSKVVCSAVHGVCVCVCVSELGVNASLMAASAFLMTPEDIR